LDTKYPTISEAIEPAMAHIIGRLYKQVEEVKDNDLYLEDACFNLWGAACSINRLAHFASAKRPGSVHFSIASGNVKSQVAEYIEKVLGFNPWFDKKNELAIRWREALK
jgi:hypothetical protein